jgi:hypothetical protein
VTARSCHHHQVAACPLFSLVAVSHSTRCQSRTRRCHMHTLPGSCRPAPPAGGCCLPSPPHDSTLNGQFHRQVRLVGCCGC